MKMKSKQRGFISFGAIKSFFQFSNVSVYIVVGLVLAYGWWRIDSLQNQNELLEAEKTTLENKVEESIVKYNDLVEDVNDFKRRVQRDIDQQRELSEEVQRIDRESRERVEDIRRMFREDAAGGERNIDDVGRERPTLLERRINDATQELGREIQEITTPRRDSNDDDDDDGM